MAAVGTNSTGASVPASYGGAITTSAGGVVHNGLTTRYPRDGVVTHSAPRPSTALSRAIPNANRPYINT